MMRNFFILLALISLGAAYTFYNDYNSKPASSKKGSEEQTALYQTVPSFSFKSLNGKSVKIADFSDKVIVLNFWATWCAPCVIEFPAMLSLAETQKETAVFIFLSIDDNKNDIERFIKKHGKSLPQDKVIIGWDEDKTISQDLFQTIKVPETYIIAPGLKITDKIVGSDVDWTSRDMQQKINTLYRERSM